MRRILSPLLVVLVLALVAIVVGQTPPDSCLVVLNGHTYDLSALVKKDAPYSVASGTYTYLMNVCGQVVGSACAGPGAAYQALTGPPLGQCLKIGTYNNPNTQWDYMDISDPSQGLQLTLDGGDLCSSKVRTTVIQFPCDKTANPGVPTSARELIPPGCKYLFTFPTIYSCLDAPSPNAGGLTGGWAFVMIYLIGFFLYCVIGVIVKWQRMGAVGIERIPNIDFWKDLPALMRDGLRYSLNKIRGLCGGGGGGGVGSSSDYQDVK